MKYSKKIVLVSPRGFCAGVTRAIDVVLEALKKYGAPIYVNHEIVHNKHVIQDLISRGAIFLKNIDDAPKDRPIIFSAHGVSKNVTEFAKHNNEIIIDATCPLVTKVHVQADKFYNLGYKIVLIGHKNHPEVEGTMGQLPDGYIFLVEDVTDIEKLNFEDEEKIAYLTQTTLSIDDTQNIISELRNKFPNVESSPKEDICYATSNRQKAIKEYANKCDAFIVVGSKNSSNSNRLVEVAKKAGCENSQLLENAESLDLKNYSSFNTIGISSGASVPEVLVENIISKFQKTYSLEIENVTLGEENVHFKLPKEVRN
tara:strand:+ start:3788 stop:4729 length:942 start_codon:yes stop_codon:yes gene_type:complete